eukprot:CAMPEP_0177635220 /NCGR_PEP_ID=MMETSP0447-20121125/3787_1 /TAXON_ID=0 /ORGANISM="Stygamoeba regulata, Strain BSH-02190019" /LENGTH=72 /DNA_ID=CAMNT_0019136997 /DNA_START=217 /DNA_END=435 /DNA_ORIENTATION=-
MDVRVAGMSPTAFKLARLRLWTWADNLFSQAFIQFTAYSLQPKSQCPALLLKNTQLFLDLLDFLDLLLNSTW